MQSLSQLNAILGYTFQQPELLQQALSHKSVGRPNNERLEFLGDALLSVIITDALYKKFPKANEGTLSRLRASLVKGETLAELAKEKQLNDFIRLGVGELKSGGHQRASILADMVEAIIAAIYLDSDLATCNLVVLQWFESRLSTLTTALEKDPKTALQEHRHATHQPLPHYKLLSETQSNGTQHFVVTCALPGTDIIEEAEGPSRRIAEQHAAAKVLAKLKEADT